MFLGWVGIFSRYFSYTCIQDPYISLARCVCECKWVVFSAVQEFNWWLFQGVTPSNPHTKTAAMGSSTSATLKFSQKVDGWMLTDCILSAKGSYKERGLRSTKSNKVDYFKSLYSRLRGFRKPSVFFSGWRTSFFLPVSFLPIVPTKPWTCQRS